MTDYRYRFVEHNGIDCLHVLLDGGDETYIPLDDILVSAVEQGYMSTVPQETPTQVGQALQDE